MYALRHRGQYDQAVASELDAMLAALRAWLTVDHNEDGTHNLRPSGFDFVPIGTIAMWGTATAPTGWLICDGAAVSRTTYQGLFELWGTSFGAGDGSTTFNLPDMRQRFPIGKAASGTGATLGGTGGTIDHTHSVSLTSSSNGGFSGSTGSGGGHTHAVSGTTGNDAAQATAQIDAGGPDPFSASIGPHSHSFSATTGSDGDHTHAISAGDHTHTVSGNTGNGNPPFLALNFIVLTGVA